MKLQLNTDSNIEGTAELKSYVSNEIDRALKHFEDKITRIEIYLSDLNAHKGGANDIQCKIEARLEKLDPVVVVSKDATTEKALRAAIDKVKSALRTTIGKIKDQ